MPRPSLWGSAGIVAQPPEASLLCTLLSSAHGITSVCVHISFFYVDTSYNGLGTHPAAV